MATRYVEAHGRGRSWIQEKILMGKTPQEYMRSLITPFNAIAAAIILVAIPLTIMRFASGLGATTNLSDANPWGLWIGFDVMSGIALAAGGYVTAAAVYIFGLKEYHPVVRPALLTGFLGYLFVIVGLLFDLGRPWRLPYPIFVSMGVTSVMLEVAMCVLLYFACQFVEFSPAVFEWLGWKKLRKIAAGITVGAVVTGVMLSTLHQSSLGALFLITPGKLHPLWYSPLLPLYFFVSSMIAGLGMVIVESMISHRVFAAQIKGHHVDMNKITLGLGKAAAVVMFAYFWVRVIDIAHANNWALLTTGMGYWFLVEMVGFILLPALLFFYATREKNVGMVRAAAILAVAGIILNRLNISVIAFNWNAADRYVPRWTEFAISLAIVTVGVLAFRWVANRLPVLREHPDYKGEQEPAEKGG